MPSGASGFLLKGMKDIHSVRKLSNADDAPLAEDMDADFVGAWPYGRHGLPVGRRGPKLDYSITYLV